jgi:hypothetical protein
MRVTVKLGRYRPRISNEMLSEEAEGSKLLSNELRI